MSKFYNLAKCHTCKSDKKNHFEGWYIKIEENDSTDVIILIFGIYNISNKKYAFIMFITHKHNYYFEYEYKTFSYEQNYFKIKIEDNIFTEDKIILNLHGKNLKKLSEDDACYLSNIIFDQSDIYPNMMISATIELKEMKLIDKPIMGIFKFIPGFIGCNHGLIALRMTINIEYLKIINSNNNCINNKDINQKLCVGYMEKDWGNAFPKSYVWIQCSRFERNRNSMFFFSIGRVPFIFMNKPIFKINGFLSVLLNDDKLFSFSIFHCIIKKFEVQKDFTNDKELVKVELSSIRNMKLIVNVERKLSKSGIHLRAPTKDGMSFNVEKHLHVKITIKLTRGNKILFFDASNFCDLEKVGNMEYFYK